VFKEYFGSTNFSIKSLTMKILKEHWAINNTASSYSGHNDLKSRTLVRVPSFRGFVIFHKILHADAVDAIFK
jgi:hypothetical protein